MDEKRYCLACGAELDVDGICTRETCMRRKIQLRQKEAAEKAENAKTNWELGFTQGGAFSFGERHEYRQDKTGRVDREDEG